MRSLEYFEVECLLSGSYILEAKDENGGKELAEAMVSSGILDVQDVLSATIQNKEFVTDVIEAADELEEEGMNEYDVFFNLSFSMVVIAENENVAGEVVNERVGKQITTLEEIIGTPLEDMAGYVKEIKMLN